MSIRIIKKKPPKEEPMSHNWSNRLSVFGRSLGSLRSAQHKYSRRCNPHKMIQVSLEIADSKSPQAAFDYMATILVEDKFPEGANFIYQHQMISKRLKKMSRAEQNQNITQMAYILSNIPSDRHPCNLSRLALKLAEEEKTPFDAEQRMACEVQKLLLRMRRHGEMPTPKDISVDEGMKRLQDIVFDKIQPTKYNLILFDIFKRNWKKRDKGTDRLYIFNLVARNFHRHSFSPQYVPSKSTPPLVKVELDDYVFDQHTKEGRKRKRGMDHFLKEGAKLENTHENIAERAGIKRKAEHIYLNDAKICNRIGGSARERKRIRESFNELTAIKGQNIISSSFCGKPNIVKKMLVKTNSFDLFVKGPYKTAEELQFQLYIDKRKAEYGLIPMEMEITNEGRLFYLTCPWKEGFEKMSPNKMYNNDILWNLLKILIFRAVFDVKKTTLKKVLVNFDTKEVISIGETSCKRARPRAEGIVHKLFSKVPNELMCKQLRSLIHLRYDDFKAEVKRYGSSGNMLL